jgi:hypothetical protein
MSIIEERHMTKWIFAAAGAVVVLGTGCSRNRPVEINAELKAAAQNWTARLTSPTELQGALQVQGTATLEPGKSANETVVRVNLSNVAPGGVHPWRLQSGRCGSGGNELLRVTGGDDMLQVGNDGHASAAAAVPGMALPTRGDYAVLVMASPENQDLVIACGNFAPPPDGMNPGMTPSPAAPEKTQQPQ